MKMSLFMLFVSLRKHHPVRTDLSRTGLCWYLGSPQQLNPGKRVQPLPAAGWVHLSPLHCSLRLSCLTGGIAQVVAAVPVRSETLGFLYVAGETNTPGVWLSLQSANFLEVSAYLHLLLREYKMTILLNSVFCLDVSTWKNESAFKSWTSL